MKTIDRTTAVLAGIIGAMTPRIAQAHLVNTEVGEFYAGMLHPLTSAEHLLPILVLAVLASQGRREAARWSLAIFPAALMAGVGAGRLLGPAQIVHLTSLLALMVMGGLLALGRPVGASVLLGTAGTVGLLLGYRSGVDMAAGDVALPFLPGVGLSGFIALALVTAWVPRNAPYLGRYLPRAAGAAGVVAGLFLIVDMPWDVGGSVARSVGLPSNQILAMLVRTGSLSPAIVAAAVLGATGWGAAHAFTPGHGKAIVAAYLVGSRSTAWHAAYLGLTVTATHTLTIFLLGLVALFAQAHVAPDQLYPWMGIVSGLIVSGLGASMFVGRLRALRGHGHHHLHHSGHSHDHSHAHGRPGHGDHDHHRLPGGGRYPRKEPSAHDHEHGPGDGPAHPVEELPRSPVTWRSLLGLGISGGLLPCPAALVLLLTAVSLERVGLGLALVLAFSFGLAGVLVAVGLIFVRGGQLLERMPKVNPALHLMPVLSALLVAALGFWVTASAVLEMWA